MSIYRRTERFVPIDARVDDDVCAPAAPAGAKSGGALAATPSAAEEEDWAKRRKSQPANGLLKPTFAWASTLPVEAQPRSLMYKFPRIANLLAAMWPDPSSFRRYMDDLLVDKRGNRQGFPVDVLKELFELRAYYEELHPDASMWWDTTKRSR
jgi:hypothetical protein